MPGKVKVKVLAGRNLPVMDRSNDTTDAYVEVKLGSITYKTDVYRKSLNPQWNSEWFRFEMDDLELQDEPLQIRLMDHDTYSANDAIGKVYLDLNPLLINSSKGKGDQPGRMISGWLPVYDTMHGIRGEVNLIVKVELFSDLNKFRESSCGVKFFFTQAVPEGYLVHIIHGFVEELVVNDDPEYQWIDKIRTPRASNEARQTLFSKLSGEVQRKIGLKALEMGGNAVIGYRQCFDLEGESGIVVRGIGTAASLVKQFDCQMSPTMGADTVGVSRECLTNAAMDENLLFPSASHAHFSRSIKRRNERAARLHKRSFKTPTSTISMPDTLIQDQAEHDHTKNENLIQRGSFHSAGCGESSRSSSISLSRDRNNLKTIGQCHSMVPSDKESSRSSSCRHHDKPFGPKVVSHPVLKSTKTPCTSVKTTEQVDSTSGDRSSEYDSSSSNQTQKCAPFQPKTPNPNDIMPLEPFPVTTILPVHRHSTTAVRPHQQCDSSLGSAEKSVDNNVKRFSKETDPLFGVDYGLEGLQNRSQLESSTSQDDKEWVSNLTDGDSDSDCSKTGRKSAVSMDSKASFLLLRKRRGSRKKDRYSKSSLMKRASENFSDKGYIIGSSERLRDEVAKFFRKKKENSDENDNESGDSMTDSKTESKASIYREARFFFRRRKGGGSFGARNNKNSSFRKTRSLHRSTSESHSLGQTSIESLPSVISEPVDPPRVSRQGSVVKEPKNSGVGSNIVGVSSKPPESLSRSQIIRLVQDLGFQTNKPLKLYISSMDALLVYNPFEDVAKCEPCLTLEAAACASASVASVEYLERERSFRVGHCSSGEMIPGVTSWSTQASSSSYTTFDPSNSSVVFSSTSSSTASDMTHIESATESCCKSVDCENSNSNFSSPSLYSHDDSSNKENVVRTQSDIHIGGTSMKKGLGQRVSKVLRRDLGLKLLSQWTVKGGGGKHTHQHGRKSNKTRVIGSASQLQARMKSVVEVENECGGNTSGSPSIDENLSIAVNKSCGDVVPPSACRSPIPEELLSEKSSSHLPTNTTNPSSSIGGTNNPTVHSSVPPQNGVHVSSSSGTGVKTVKGSHGGKGVVDVTTRHLTNAAVLKIQQHNQAGVTVSGSWQTTTAYANASDGCNKVNSNANVLNRRSSDSDLSTPPKSNSSGNIGIPHGRGLPMPPLSRPGINMDPFDMMEYPFITLAQFPPSFIYHIGGTVTARSVKLLERISNLDEPESRDSWWNEIRMEIRSHCRAFGCNLVVDYGEQTTMCDDVCVLSACGTAVIAITSNIESGDVVFTSKTGSRDIIDQQGTPIRALDKDLKTPLSRNEKLSNQTNVRHFVVSVYEKHAARVVTQLNEVAFLQPMKTGGEKIRHDSDGSYESPCSILHVPVNAGNPLPSSTRLVRCCVCKNGKVPEVLLATIDLPTSLQTNGQSCLLQAQICRPKRDCKGEMGAKEVSDGLPFLEYELHRRFVNKLKVKGMNAVFGFKMQICLGEKLMVGIATGTAVYLSGLPPPSVPLITAGNMKTDAQKVSQFQKVVQEAYERNREFYQIRNVPMPQSQVSNGRHSASTDGEDSDEEIVVNDVSTGNKSTYILEVDDAEDIDIISALIDSSPPLGVHMNNVDYLHGFDDYRILSQQMFIQVWRCHIPSLNLRQFTMHFDKLIRLISFKLRRIKPCVLSKLQFHVDLPEQDELHISVSGVAVGVGEKLSTGSDIQVEFKSSALFKGNTGSTATGSEDGDLMFNMEDEACKDPDGSILSDGTVICGKPRSSPHKTPSDVGSNCTATHSDSGSSTVSLMKPAGGSKMPTLSSSPGSSVNPSASASLVNIGPNVSENAKTLEWSCVELPHFSAAAQQALTLASIRAKTGLVGNMFGHHHIFFRRRAQSFCSKMIPYMSIPSILKSKNTVEITPLSYIHGAKIDKYLGNLNYFFIRETTSMRECGGLSGFVHSFIAEVLAILRAHVAALGGNAMVSYFNTELALLHNPHKNQGQCLINVGGDVVQVTYMNLFDENS